MLTHLSIKNFAIIAYSEVTFERGMTVITGETGAGKSILLYALNIVLGARVDKNFLHSDKNTEVCATFDLANIKAAEQWLYDNDLIEPDTKECILRRKISFDGKSKAYINDSLVTLSQVKALSERLISIYSQHAHHALLQKENQLARLDIYADHTTLLEQVKQSAKSVHILEKSLAGKQTNQEALEAKKTLLEYQYNELSQLGLEENELETLEASHEQLANVDHQISSLQNCAHKLNEDDQNITHQIHSALQLLTNITPQSDSVKTIIELLKQSEVYTQEAYQEVTSTLGKLEVNPEKLAEINAKLAACHDLARKHKINIKQLYTHTQQISEALQTIQEGSNDMSALQETLKETKAQYSKSAEQLSLSRAKYAKLFAQNIETQMKQLNMPNGQFHIALSNADKISDLGQDNCEYQISLNKGHALSSLSKIASGGELSRIGLAIQVISSQKIAPPTILFDEVDVGISGGTSEVVGKLLKTLSQCAQVICITHQAQVAAQGDQHLFVAKDHNAEQTTSHIIKLSKDERVDEIANILGGVEITPQTRSHAKEMFEQLQT
ncbi:DNA repair protein RecN [Francisellaceae bacterium]|nr:DNA repair protein RecN [Francisellaceae bacterium]